MKYLYYILLTILFASCGKSNLTSISLAGKWQFAMDSLDIGIQENWITHEFREQVALPGTMDQSHKGIPNMLEPALSKPQILHLTRKHSYVGPAWYKKEVLIPEHWKEKNIFLKLERVLWEGSVWVDNHEVKTKGESLVTPHYFDLTPYLSPGKHTLSIRIDNRKKYDISFENLAHAYTNDTQIMWNGILGEMALVAEESIFLPQIDVYPDLTRKEIRIKVQVKNTGAETSGKLTASVRLPQKNILLKEVNLDQIKFEHGEKTIELTYPMGKEVYLWSEFSPSVYELTVSLNTKQVTSVKSTTFGMRELRTENATFLINERKIFLRGTLECCIFPLTGHPPMDQESWRKLMKTAREWGLNHLRFHSWCPPKAAFEVADEMGFYLQVELPLWSLQVGRDERTNRFLYEEADRIMAEYGNHPSFCFFSLGNELQPDFHFMRDFMLQLKEKDPRHLYTTTSFTFEKGHGDWPEPEDDFFITQWTKKGWVRGQGIFSSAPPSFDKDYSEAVKGMPVPLVTHEIGQYAVYPNLEEIDKYTGVLLPLNFKAVKKDLERKGLIHKAKEYLNASGKLAALLYKEEIERALKTSGCSGFQLLDLHDFPGQGTALVGLLDAFWEEKGFITAGEFRTFCSPVTPLLRYPKATYLNSEFFEATLEIAHFGENDLLNQQIIWQLQKSDGTILKKDSIQNVDLFTGSINEIGDILIPLSGITSAAELSLSVFNKNLDYVNSWKIWVYPEKLLVKKGDIFITRHQKEAEKALKEGKKVLFNPAYETLVGLEGKFLPVFWSPVHFPKQAGTMGILCDPTHKVFTHFPTQMHTDWQWWHLLTQSKTLLIDSIQNQVEPLVECIDNFIHNRRLATLFEANCENGKLVLCSMDLMTHSTTIPEKRQLLFSILEYMKSSDFQPTKHLSFDKIQSLIDPENKEYYPSKPESIY